jgi:hypothetical protein
MKQACGTVSSAGRIMFFSVSALEIRRAIMGRSGRREEEVRPVGLLA